MKFKSVRRAMLTGLLIGMLTLAFGVYQIQAESTTIIVPDDYPSIQEAINNANEGDTIYVRNGTYYENVVVNKSISLIGENRDATIIDGNSAGKVIEVTTSNVTINGFTMLNSTGLVVYNSSSTTISHNKIIGNNYGILLNQSSNNALKNNTISGNSLFGIYLHHSNNNIIIGNNISHNGLVLWMLWWSLDGIKLYNSSDNTIFHNNFVGNSVNTLGVDSVNVWDNGYPSGGNYWGSVGFDSADLYNGPSQNVSGSDGIADTPYDIHRDKQDNYPLINPWSPTQTIVKMKGKDYPVTIVSNTTINLIVTTKNTLRFESLGPTGEKGYIHTIFPIVNTTEIKVFIDGEKLTPPPFPLINANATHYFIYFELTVSTHNIEFQFAPTPDKLELVALVSALTILLAVAVIVAVYVGKRKRNTEIIS
jgi:parallel beta-helix repeat protein